MKGEKEVGERVVMGFYLIATISVSEFGAVTVGETTMAIAVTSVSVGQNWSSVHHRLGHQRSSLGDQWNGHSSGHINGNCSGHWNAHWPGNSVRLKKLNYLMELNSQ